MEPATTTDSEKNKNKKEKKDNEKDKKDKEIIITTNRRPSIFVLTDEAEREAERLYSELEAKLASKQLYKALVDKAVLMNLKGEV